MQQTEQNAARTPAHRPLQAQEDKQRRGAAQNEQHTLRLALQAVQAGVPLTRLPAAMVLALSAQMGNSALLDLLAGQDRRIEPVTALPPPDAVRTAPKDIKTAPAAASAPPDWAALPAVQAAPAAPDGLAGQGGVPFAGG